jgi:hypothetical protein
MASAAAPAPPASPRRARPAAPASAAAWHARPARPAASTTCGPRLPPAAPPRTRTPPNAIWPARTPGRSARTAPPAASLARPGPLHDRGGHLMSILFCHDYMILRWPCGCRKLCHPHLSWVSCSQPGLGGTAAGVPAAARSALVTFRLLYLIFARMCVLPRSDNAKNTEILVLRHQIPSCNAGSDRPGCPGPTGRSWPP